MNNKTLKILGFTVTVIGGLATIASGLISEKKQEGIIEDKVAEAIAKLAKKES